MNYNELLSLIVIVGGYSRKGEFLDDINILDIKTMEWMEVINKGKQFTGRCAHSSTINGLIFYS